MRTVTHEQCGASGIYSTIFAILCVQPVGKMTINANNAIQRRDRYLLIIVINEIVTYVVTTPLYPLMLLETIISTNVISKKSAQYSQIEGFILCITYLLLVFNSAAPFYTYCISSKPFRQDVKQLIMNIYWKITRQMPVATVSKTDRALTQRETRV